MLLSCRNKSRSSVVGGYINSEKKDHQRQETTDTYEQVDQDTSHVMAAESCCQGACSSGIALKIIRTGQVF